MIRIMDELNFVPSNTITIYCDKKSIILIVKNLVFHVRTKLIEFHHHFIRD